jgi:tyrosine-specific transport protein
MELALLKKDNLIGATLLVSGCCIGAGMIGLPVVSAMAGFIPTTLAMFLCYLFATGTGLLILEATLWFDQKVNLISIANFALGKFGKFLAWFLFLFLFYCLFVAYIDGGGQLTAQIVGFLFNTTISREVGIIICVPLVALIVYGGTHAVSSINRIFLVGLGVSYLTLIFLGIPYVNEKQLLYTNYVGLSSAIPILLVCFGYQNLVPTLVHYVKRNVDVMRYAIFIGNLIPFLIYTLWNFVILGILPDMDSANIVKIASESNMVSGLLEKTSQSQAVLQAVKAFTFFGLFTPFIASTLSFVDFIKDGLKMSSGSKYEFFVYLLVLVPPTVLTLSYPHLFLKALGLVGGVVDVALFGILPILIVSIGRYFKKVEGPYKAPGGILFLSFLFMLCLMFLTFRN